VRMPDGMRDRLKAAASENKRSMNAEIVARIEGSFGREDAMRDAAETLAAHNGDMDAAYGYVRPSEVTEVIAQAMGEAMAIAFRKLEQSGAVRKLAPDPTDGDSMDEPK